MIVRELINQATNKLKNKSTSPSLDAEVLLAFVWNKSPEYLAANFPEPVPRAIEKQFQKLIAKRAQNLPVAYLTGEKYFYGLKFKVNKNVLVPRPVTESLVDMTLEAIKDLRLRIKDKKISILDIGTGSGAIIISLASNLNPKSYNLFASDISPKALAVAKQNARLHKARITFKQGSLLKPWSREQFDIIIANLPYLPRRTDPSTKFEPTQALVAKKQGLALIEALFQQVSTLHPAPSTLFLEIGHDQGAAIKKLAKRYLPAYKIQVIKDFTNRTRYAVLER